MSAHAEGPVAAAERSRGGRLDASIREHHDAFVRTTLTLDPDVAKLIEDAAAEQRKPIKQVVNEALRRGLLPRDPNRTPKRYRVKPHRTSLLPGIDPESFNKLTDELEDDAVAARMRERR